MTTSGAPQPPAHCANCGAPMAGRYCHACGQDSVPDETALASWRGQWQRLRSTLHALVFAPGRLTQEHLSGGRIRYIPPFTLFLNIVTIFFLFSVVTQFRVQSFVRKDDTGHLAQAIEHRAERAGVSKEVFLERVERRFQGVYTLCVASISLAGYTLLFRLFYRGRWQGWRGPFTFALHYLAFIFLVFPFVLAAVSAASELVPPLWLRAAGFAGSAGIAVSWLTLAGRRLFGESWPRAIMKAFAIVAAGFVVDNAMFTAAVFVTFNLA
jgi:hypothetical protein